MALEHDFGTLVPGATYYLPFTTVNALGQPVAYDVSPGFAVYKDNSLTQLTVAGHGLTVTENFDTVDTTLVGGHLLTAVLTDSFYTVNAAFAIQYTAGTLDGIPLAGRWFGRFNTFNNHPMPMKAQAFTFGFRLLNASGDPVTGATPTVVVSKDDAASGATTGTSLEIDNGNYRFAASAADATGDRLLFYITATGAVPVSMYVRTRAK